MKKELILASQSARRFELLEKAGYDFITRKYDVEEIYPENMTIPSEIAVYLSELKSSAAQEELSHNQVVLTSDTIVVLDDEILGKPRDRDDAIQTLTRLSDRSHEVITAVSLAQKKGVVSAFDRSKVLFHPLSLNEIEFYIDTCSPMDKAGSYGIQDWLGLCKVKSIKGSHSNIMGLPMQLTFEMLKSIGIKPKGL